MGPQTSPIEDKTRIAGVLSANRHLRKGNVRLGGDPPGTPKFARQRSIRARRIYHSLRACPTEVRRIAEHKNASIQ